MPFIFSVKLSSLIFNFRIGLIYNCPHICGRNGQKRDIVRDLFLNDRYFWVATGGYSILRLDYFITALTFVVGTVKK